MTACEEDAACYDNVFVTKWCVIGQMQASYNTDHLIVDLGAPYCYTKVYEIPGYTRAFLELDCLTLAGVETVYPSFTNAVAGPSPVASYLTITTVVQQVTSTIATVNVAQTPTTTQIQNFPQTSTSTSQAQNTPFVTSSSSKIP